MSSLKVYPLLTVTLIFTSSVCFSHFDQKGKVLNFLYQYYKWCRFGILKCAQYLTSLLSFIFSIQLQLFTLSQNIFHRNSFPILVGFSSFFRFFLAHFSSFFIHLWYKSFVAFNSYFNIINLSFLIFLYLKNVNCPKYFFPSGIHIRWLIGLAICLSK